MEVLKAKAQEYRERGDYKGLQRYYIKIKIQYYMKAAYVLLIMFPLYVWINIVSLIMTGRIIIYKNGKWKKW